MTRVLAFGAVRGSEARCRDYYRNGPERPFCRTHTDPKLATLRRRFAAHVIAKS